MPNKPLSVIKLSNKVMPRQSLNSVKKLASANNEVADQKAVQAMLLQQRDSVSGVSLDEELNRSDEISKSFPSVRTARFLRSMICSIRSSP